MESEKTSTEDRAGWNGSQAWRRSGAAEAGADGSSSRRAAQSPGGDNRARSIFLSLGQQSMAIRQPMPGSVHQAAAHQAARQPGRFQAAAAEKQQGQGQARRARPLFSGTISSPSYPAPALSPHNNAFFHPELACSQSFNHATLASESALLHAAANAGAPAEPTTSASSRTDHASALSPPGQLGKFAQLAHLAQLSQFAQFSQFAQLTQLHSTPNHPPASPWSSVQMNSTPHDAGTHHSQEQQQQQQQHLQHGPFVGVAAAANSPLTPTGGAGGAEASAESSVSPRVSAVAAAAAARVNQACASCRRKKVRCDGVQPACGNCVSRGMDCTYLAQKKRGRPPKALQRQATMPYYMPTSGAAPYSAPLHAVNDLATSPSSAGFGLHQLTQQAPTPTQHSMHAYFGQWAPAQCAMPSASIALSQPITHQTLFTGGIGSAATDTHGDDYFGTFHTPARADVVGMSSIAMSLPPTMAAPPLLSAQPIHMDSTLGLGTANDAGQAPLSTPSALHGNGLVFTDFVQHFMPLTEPPPLPPVLQHFQTGGAGGQPHVQTATPPLQASASDALSKTLGNVAIAMTTHDVDSARVQTTLDHLSHVTKAVAPTPGAQLHAQPEDGAGPGEGAGDAAIHASLLQLERRPGLAARAVHNYFSFIHPQAPIIHRPTFLRQVADGSVSRAVWLALRALAARTLLHSNVLADADVAAEEEHFAAQARAELANGLRRPSVDVVQGLALLSLYLLGTPRWQEASMFWCKATRLAQLMEFHVIDAPTRAIATKMHFGIFEPPTRFASARPDAGLIPGDIAGHHVPLAQALTPLDAELRRRLWWTLFTNERFCAIAERLPTMVDEARMFVHFPCPARDWDEPEFSYQPPPRVPRYLREGYTRAELGDDLNRLTLGQEMNARKKDNLYLMCEIEYGFSMSHLVAFLADMGALFRPRAPYGNDYIPVFAHVSGPNKMRALRANVERVERVLEMVRQGFLQRLAAVAPHTPHAPPPQPADHAAPGIDIPHLHQLTMLILYSVLNIHLYRMVFQIHYELSSTMPAPDRRRPEDSELLAAFDLYVKELWVRTTTAAQQVSRILRGEFPGVPHWVLTLAGIKKSSELSSSSASASASTTPPATDRPSQMDIDAATEDAAQPASSRLRSVFQERIKAQEAKLHEVTLSVFASFRRTLPYALLLAAKVHVDNIEWWTRERQDDKMARAYLDLADIVRFLETHQSAFSSTDYVSLVKGMMMHVDIS